MDPASRGTGVGVGGMAAWQWTGPRRPGGDRELGSTTAAGPCVRQMRERPTDAGRSFVKDKNSRYMRSTAQAAL
jgi:hypothetical protein